MITMQDVRSKLDEMDVSYDMTDDGAIYFSQTGNKNFRFITAVEIGGVICKVILCTGIQFSEYNFKLLSKINEFNREYNMFSFYIDLKHNNELIMESYVNVKCTSVDGVINNIILGNVILEDLYPETQRLIWNN